VLLRQEAVHVLGTEGEWVKVAVPRLGREGFVTRGAVSATPDTRVAFLGVDVPWDDLQPAQLFVQTFQLPYPVGRDASGAVSQTYGVEATPTTFFIDKRGAVAARIEGAVEPRDLARRIEALLK